MNELEIQQIFSVLAIVVCVFFVGVMIGSITTRANLYGKLLEQMLPKFIKTEPYKPMTLAELAERMKATMGERNSMLDEVPYGNGSIRSVPEEQTRSKEE